MNNPIPKTSDPSTRLLAGVVLTFVLLWVALSVGCGRRVPQANTSSAVAGPTIVTTTGMVRDMVAALVGEDAQVEAIMGPGVDPHLYQPTRTDSVKLLEADIVVYNGLHLEGRLGEVLEIRGDGNGVTIAVAELLPAERLMDADAGLHDPHIWMDVSLWSEAMQLVAAELAAAMPNHAIAIRSRADRYAQQLAELDAWGSRAVESIPEPQRILVTAHDAFQYFGRRYDVEVHGVQGVSTISDAAISDVNRLVELIVSKQVPAVFFESSVSPRQVKAIVEGAQRKGIEVSSDAELLSDSMGADGTTSGNYIGMMQHNFRTITEALGGTVSPPRGAEEKFTVDQQTSVPIGHAVTSSVVVPAFGVGR